METVRVIPYSPKTRFMPLPDSSNSAFRQVVGVFVQFGGEYRFATVRSKEENPCPESASMFLDCQANCKRCSDSFGYSYTLLDSSRDGRWSVGRAHHT